ncbi:MAG: hypothetical protein PVI31_07460 [Gemmatimonadota bacterium]|jgi:hypothetical protein
MFQRLLHRSFLALGLMAVLVPAATQAQVREVVSKQVSVGRSEATLALEFSDDSALEISLRNGDVLIDGDRVGSYEPGGQLDAAWRELLGQAVSLEDGPLSEALTDWTVPADLTGNPADVAQSIDRALEESVDVDVQVDASDGTVSVSIGDERSFLSSLLGASDRMALIPEALDGLGSDVRVHVGEDVDIGEDEVVDGSLVVIDGDLRIEGEVDGNVVLIGGRLDMAEGSEVTGAVRLADARMGTSDGSVDDGIVQIDDRVDRSARIDVDTERIRDEVREELRREFRINDRERINVNVRDRDGSIFSAPFRAVASAVGGLLENALMILILGLLGAAAVMFAGENVDVIAETARRSPGRAAMVGLAGTFLLLPAWILGAVALAVSIIGIPVAIAWLPLFPVAAVLAAVLGYLAVARNAGEWLADSEYPWTGWIRKSNPLLTIVGGLVGLMALFVAANVLTIVPFFGFVTGLLAVLGTVLTFVVVQIGFGAVLLTRAGRRREYWPNGYDTDAAWEAAMSVDVEDEASTENGKTEDVGGEEKHDA